MLVFRFSFWRRNLKKCSAIKYDKVLVNRNKFTSSLSLLGRCQNLVLLENVDQKSVFIVRSQHVLKNQVARMLEQNHDNHCSFTFNHNHHSSLHHQHYFELNMLCRSQKCCVTSFISIIVTTE